MDNESGVPDTSTPGSGLAGLAANFADATRHRVVGAVGSFAGADVVQDSVQVAVGELIDPLLDDMLPDVLAKLAAQPELLVPMVEALMPPLLDKILPDVMDRLAADPELMLPLINSLLGPIMETALPTVLDQLAQDPDPVRALVWGQSTSIVTDMANVGRSAGVRADDRIERIARKVTFRKERPPFVAPDMPPDPQAPVVAPVPEAEVSPSE